VGKPKTPKRGEKEDDQKRLGWTGARKVSEGGGAGRYGIEKAITTIFSGKEMGTNKRDCQGSKKEREGRAPKLVTHAARRGQGRQLGWGLPRVPGKTGDETVLERRRH